MATISADAPILTLINTFDVSPVNADRLVGLLAEATRTVMCHLPGFVSANIHKSEDGTRVVNYAQWASKADFEAMQSDPTALEHMATCAEIANGFEPVIYTVRFAEEAGGVATGAA